MGRDATGCLYAALIFLAICVMCFSGCMIAFNIGQALQPASPAGISAQANCNGLINIHSCNVALNQEPPHDNGLDTILVIVAVVVIVALGLAALIKLG